MTTGSRRSAGGRRARPTGRQLHTRVKTAKGRKLSSKLWLERQLNDPYVAEAKARGYRSRAAFKLLQIDEKHGILPKQGRVVDLGAAPGGWTQVALERCGAKGQIVAVDIQEMESVEGAVVLKLDSVRDTASALTMIQDFARQFPGDRPLHLEVRSASGKSIVLEAGTSYRVSDEFAGQEGLAGWMR